jgi:hypothetical protein
MLSGEAQIPVSIALPFGPLNLGLLNLWNIDASPKKTTDMSQANDESLYHTLITLPLVG